MNNCQTCEHKSHTPPGGHCYMFRTEPEFPCMQHTGRKFPMPPIGSREMMMLTLLVEATRLPKRPTDT